MLGVVGVACALRVCLILRKKPVGLPEPAGMACTINLGARWDTYDCHLEMAALSRLRIGYNETLVFWSHQVAPPVGPARVGHGCGVPPAAVWAQQVAAPAPLELVAVLRWQGFAPLELAAAPLEAGGHPTFPSLGWGDVGF